MAIIFLLLHLCYLLKCKIIQKGTALNENNIIEKNIVNYKYEIINASSRTIHIKKLHILKGYSLGPKEEKQRT